MTAVISKPGIEKKLEILAADGQYDLACACATGKDEHRKRDTDGKWIYPVTLPNGGTSVLFKTLISNVCSSDCKYCPLRSDRDVRRCTLTTEETVDTFLDYWRRKKVFGLFLSSGLIGSADNTMARLNTVASLLRKKHGFAGYIHLKIIPGASAAAIEKAVSLASAVSLNIETPGEKNLALLSSRKQYLRDIIEPMKLISSLTARGARYEGVKHTTQFIVAAAGEADRDIVRYVWGLYDRLRLNRVYFSAYQKGLGAKDLPAETAPAADSAETFTREHRLYQVDFLLRKYGFTEKDIIFDENNRLSLSADPKEIWAINHPRFFPVDVNCADKFSLLKVPGLGPVTVNRILRQRRTTKIRRIEDIGRPGRLLTKAGTYLRFC